MSETTSEHPLRRAIRFLSSKKNPSEKEPSGQCLNNEKVLELIQNQGKNSVRVCVDERPPILIPTSEFNAKGLAELPDHAILEISKNPLVKTGEEEWQSGFIESWHLVEREGREKEKERRWQKLSELGWPVVLWHGTRPSNFREIQSQRKHVIFTREFLTDSMGYAGAETILAYAIPVKDLTDPGGMSAKKFGIREKKRPPYLTEEEFQDKGTRPVINLNYELAYPHSEELVAYLEALNMIYRIEKETGEKIIRVPIWQRYYQLKEEKMSEFKPETEEPVAEESLIRRWDHDLLPSEEVLFNDQASIIIRREPIPVPV